MQTYYELQDLSDGLIIQQYTIGKQSGRYTCDSDVQVCLFPEDSKGNLFFIKKHMPHKIKFDYFYSDLNSSLNETNKTLIEKLCQPQVSLLSESSFHLLPNSESFSETAALFLLKTIQTPRALALVPNAWYLGVKKRLKSISKFLENNSSFLIS
jgi:hypothetical protein